MSIPTASTAMTRTKAPFDVVSVRRSGRMTPLMRSKRKALKRATSSSLQREREWYEWSVEEVGSVTGRYSDVRNDEEVGGATRDGSSGGIGGVDAPPSVAVGSLTAGSRAAVLRKRSNGEWRTWSRRMWPVSEKEAGNCIAWVSGDEGEEGDGEPARAAAATANE
jgi:hypothetical protein